MMEVGDTAVAMTLEGELSGAERLKHYTNHKAQKHVLIYIPSSRVMTVIPSL